MNALQFRRHKPAFASPNIVTGRYANYGAPVTMLGEALQKSLRANSGSTSGEINRYVIITGNSVTIAIDRYYLHPPLRGVSVMMVDT